MGKRKHRDYAAMHQHSGGKPWQRLSIEGHEHPVLTRHGALKAVMRGLLRWQQLKDGEVKHLAGLIHLFNLQPEDLLEAGLDYETFRAIQYKFCLLD